TSSFEAPNWVWMRGMATLTMLVSSTAMNIPTTTTLSGSSQLPVVGGAAAGAGLGTGAGAGAGAARRCGGRRLTTVAGADTVSVYARLAASSRIISIARARVARRSSRVAPAG